MLKKVLTHVFSHSCSCVLNVILNKFPNPKSPVWMLMRTFHLGKRQKYKCSLVSDFPRTLCFCYFVFMLLSMTFCFVCFTSTPKQPWNFDSLTRTQTFSSCSVMLEKFSLTLESRVAAGCRSSWQQGLEPLWHHTDRRWRERWCDLDRVPYVSSAAVCSDVDHTAACSCTHSHKHTTCVHSC